jgi:hypothetical protein
MRSTACWRSPPANAPAGRSLTQSSREILAQSRQDAEGRETPLMFAARGNGCKHQLRGDRAVGRSCRRHLSGVGQRREENGSRGVSEPHRRCALQAHLLVIARSLPESRTVNHPVMPGRGPPGMRGDPGSPLWKLCTSASLGEIISPLELCVPRGLFLMLAARGHCCLEGFSAGTWRKPSTNIKTA